MDSWIRTVEISIGLELFLGAIIIMIVNRRFKNGTISRKTFHMQNLEIFVLIIFIVAIEFLAINFTFLRNKFILTIVEFAIVILFLIIDRRINGRESFLGGS